MRAVKICLKNFRNHADRQMDLSEKTVIVGENGSGKTNILEAVYLAGVGKSFRADSDVEMVRYNEQTATVSIETDKDELNIILTNGEIAGARKRFLVNGVPRRLIDFLGHLRIVLFGPADLDLITGSPSIRRRYLDFVISQVDREYRRSLISYEKGVRQRNKILEKIREGEAERGQLWFWDKLLIKNGNYLTERREDFLKKANENGTRYAAVYDKSVISEGRLAQYEIEEVAAASTLVGPHRDDFNVEMQGKDVSKFGSRGEQRMAVVWLKKMESRYLTVGGEMPVWLLDDIFSELDHRHREEIENEIGNLIANGGQVVMTTADEHMLPTDNWRVIQF